MNNNPFANGSVIFTQSGYYAREFQKRTHGGMVGINVGIPVPVGVFPFSGHKQSFFGDLHCPGKDGVRFYTESKCVTSRWFDEEEAKREKSTRRYDLNAANTPNNSSCSQRTSRSKYDGQLPPDIASAISGALIRFLLCTCR